MIKQALRKSFSSALNARQENIIEEWSVFLETELNKLHFRPQHTHTLHSLPHLIKDTVAAYHGSSNDVDLYSGGARFKSWHSCSRTFQG